MNPDESPIIRTLRQAGGVSARRRAALFLLRALLVLIVAIPLALLADVLFHFSGSIRLGGGILLAVALVASLAAAFFIGVFIRPPLLRTARLLESRNPALGSKLVNILQLENDARLESASPLTRSLAKHAVLHAGNSLDLAALPPLAREPRLRRVALRTAAVPVLLLLITLAGGRHVRQQWLRFLDPFGDHPAFSLTHLEITSPPAEQEILYGGSAKIEVKATGHQPRELFLTATSTGENPPPPLTLPMVARGDGTFVAKLDGITRPLDIVAHTADGSTRSHRHPIRLILTPQIGPATVQITPPAYTGLKPRLINYRFTALQALEGTEIAFQLTSNRPLGEGSLEIDSGSAESVSLKLQPAADGPENSAATTLTAEQSGRLKFKLVDATGHAATETPTASLTVTKDLPPAIVITAPDADSLIVENFHLPLIIDATDDYGIRQIRLHIAVNDKFTTIDPVEPGANGETRHRLTHQLDLAELGAQPGDEITIFAEAIDSRPEPQLSRTTTRRMEVITEDDYNDHIRRMADVAAISGKYEVLVDRLERRIAEQERIAAKMAELREKLAATPEDPEALAELTKTRAAQSDVNEALSDSADEMDRFGRENPVYDFEKELHQQLEQHADSIREAIERNTRENNEALANGAESPDQETVDALAAAAQKHWENLSGGAEETREKVIEPLQDLAQLHELMKSFNRFKDLAEDQEQLAQQSKAYEAKPELNAEDRLALRDLAAQQRDLSAKLTELEKKLRHDATQSAETFPEAASSAKQLADAIDAANMPSLARDAAANLFQAKAADGHSQAQKLSDEMNRLFEDVEQGQQQAAQGLDQKLRLQRGMKPGDSLRQMLLSKNFRPLPGDGGAGAGGQMASAMLDGNPLILGGESLLDGPIASAMLGKGDNAGQGMPGSPIAQLDPTAPPENDLQSARRTSTPGASTLLLEYENIADAYFRRLTTKP